MDYDRAKIIIYNTYGYTTQEVSDAIGWVISSMSAPLEDIDQAYDVMYDISNLEEVDD
jgi:hypothetical protein